MSIIAPDSLVFDIGAHLGTEAVRFLAAGAGKVVCVEPCWDNFCHLVRRPKVVPVHAAAWDTCAEVLPMSYCLNTPGWSSCQPDKWIKAYPSAQWADPEWVATVTLDELRRAFGQPHGIKIDVEGSERQVLQGLTEKCPVLWFEFHQKFVEDALAALEYCGRIGYTKVHYTRDDIDLETMPTTPMQAFVEAWLKDAPEWGNFTLV